MNNYHELYLTYQAMLNSTIMILAGLATILVLGYWLLPIMITGQLQSWVRTIYLIMCFMLYMLVLVYFWGGYV